MIKTQHTLCLGLIIVMICSLISCSRSSKSAQTKDAPVATPNANVQAPASGSGLSSHFVDLQGWQAGEADELKFDHDGKMMINVAREYKKGDKTFSAVLSIGNSTTQYVGDTTQIDSDDGKIETMDINGFKTIVAYLKPDMAGSLSVLLKEDAKRGILLGFAFEKMELDEAIDTAKKLDWNAIKKDAEGK